MPTKDILNQLDKIKIKVLTYKKSCELNIIGAMYKDIENLYHSNLALKNFSTNLCKVYFTIASQIILKEKKEELDDITIGVYLEKHEKLKNKYEEYGGYKTISDMMDLINPKNMDAYKLENEKWQAVMMMLDFGFVVDLKEIADLNAEEIYNMYEAKLNHVFLSVENEEKAYDLAHDIDSRIDEWNDGLAVGLPFANSPLLTSETGGIMLGEVNLIGGTSGSGKTSFVRNVILPSVLAEDERLLYMINEQSLEKTQREIIVWVANNILKKDIQKYTIRNGAYTPEVWAILRESAQWLKENSDKILILPFKTYTKSKAIKTIRKYASLGFKYFVLDTFKLGADSDVKIIIQQLKVDMVDLYDLVKGEGLNVSLTCTFQLNKNSVKERYYTQHNIGESKSIIDVAGLCVMFRRLLPDEVEGEKNELKVYKLEGKYKNTKIPVKLDSEKMYFILFIVKNREGASESYQIVVEHCLGTNKYKEIGICNVSVDF